MSEPEASGVDRGVQVDAKGSLLQPAAFTFAAYGVHFGVATDAPELVDRLPNHLPPGAQLGQGDDDGRLYEIRRHRDPSEGEPRYTVYADRKAMMCGVGADAALRTFEADTQIHLAEMSPDFVFVHAGVVGWQGEAIMLPGRSYSGKTTLVAELIRQGAEYYSDEYAVLDRKGNVHPYARALSIRQEGGKRVTRCSIGELGGLEGRYPLPVGLVVMSRYKQQSQWQPRRLSPGRGALALLANTVPARRQPEIVLPTLRHVVSTAGVFSSERGEASAAVAQILELARQR